MIAISNCHFNKCHASIIIGCLTFLAFSTSYATTYYMPDRFATLRAACAGMSGGDTLIIRDGTYSGLNNTMVQGYMPPSGSAGAYTIIKAEHDGKAYFPDGWVNCSNTVNAQYLQFEGLKSGGGCTLYGRPTPALNPSYIKVLRCSFGTLTTANSGTVSGTAAGLNIIEGSYFLVEDCWSYGANSYSFSVYAGTCGNTHHVVFRRCVARKDNIGGNTNNNTSAFAAYRANYIAFQNCIVIDGNRDEYWIDMQTNSNIERPYGFYILRGAAGVSIDGCIVLNFKGMAFGGSPSNVAAWSVNNSVAWDVPEITWTRNTAECSSTAFSPYTMNRLTAGHIRSTSSGVADITARGFTQYMGSTGNADIKNSNISDVLGTVFSSNVFSSDYNCLYGNTTNYSGLSGGAHDTTTINPLAGSLLYLPRIESGSALSGTGSGGSDRGANILYKIGTSGTYYGDVGWNTVTSDALWPWPNEDRIKSEMAAYSSGTVNIIPSGTGTLSGTRGFCNGNSKDGTAQTLTKYIWEYLGNRIPAEIYRSLDTTPPSIPQSIQLQIIN